MPFIEAKCPNCAASLPVDSAREAWVCGYCGTPFVVEKAIQNVNVTVTVQPADFEIRGGVLVKYRGNETEVAVPDGVVSIGSQAFMDCHTMTRVVIPEGVDEILASAFYGCKRLRSLQLPTTLKTIGARAFDRCDAISPLNLPVGLEVIQDGAFTHCDSLVNVTIPEGLKHFADCFRFCASLQTISLPRSLESLCYDNWKVARNSSFNVGHMFQGCDKLTAVFAYFPGRITIPLKGPGYHYLDIQKPVDLSREETVRWDRRLQGKCIHCGGKEGFLDSKHCKQCKREMECRIVDN